VHNELNLRATSASRIWILGDGHSRVNFFLEHPADRPQDVLTPITQCLRRLPKNGSASTRPSSSRLDLAPWLILRPKL
jgi:hypothetical protein